MLPEISFEKYTLSNGLQVILHRDLSVPLAAVNLWYHVGSKNERRGRTGFAHLFEHMMFQGTEHVPDFFGPLEKIGAALNGSTAEDRTNYWETVPSNYLGLALWMESDRMGFLLPGIDQKKLDNQRDVVKNERRQVVDNQPYGKVDEVMLEALYPPNHPYSWPVIGSMEDLSAASLEDVKEFFRRFYTPNNASLCIAGDFKAREVRRLVERYFAPIPPGPPVVRMARWVPRLDAEKRIHMTDRVSLARLYLAWHSPALFAEGDAELDLLASILSKGKNSRLYRSLVYEKQIAQEVQAAQDSRELAGVFEIVVTARPGHSVAELEQAVAEELERLRKEPPAAEEVISSKNEWEARFVRHWQSLGGFGGRADLLNFYNVYTGDPEYYRKDYERHLALTPESIHEAVNRTLFPDRKVVIGVEPHGDLKPAAVKRTDRSVPPRPGANPRLRLPRWQEFVLGNGLKLWIVEDHRLPLVQLNLIVNAGWAADPPGKPGVSSLMSELQDEGTSSRTALQIAQELKNLGANLATRSNFDASFVQLNTLTRHLPQAMDLFADVVLNPTFPEEELVRRKAQYLARILQENQEPVTASLKTFLRALYGPDHPYGQPYTGSGTRESIPRIGREDLAAFYRSHFHANNATLIVVGDVKAEAMASRVESLLREWAAADILPPTVPEVPPLERTRLYLVDKPGAVQSVIVAGHLGAPRNTPDYPALEVMNAILGGKFTSRINLNLREEKGYTYGARSLFMYRRFTGPFLAYAPVHTRFTRESLAELLKEIRGILGEKPVTDAEVKDTKNYLILGYPKQFETIGKVAGKIGELAVYDLPADALERYVPEVDGISPAEVQSAAQKYLHPEKLLVVVVGDRAKIESGLRSLRLGEIGYLDPEGNPAANS